MYGAYNTCHTSRDCIHIYIGFAVHPEDEHTRRVHYTRDVDAETSGVRAGEGVILPSVKGITSTEARLHTVWSTAPQCLEHGSTVFGARLHSVWSTAPQCLEHGSTVFGARLHSVWSTAPQCLEHGSTVFGARLHTVWSTAPHCLEPCCMCLSLVLVNVVIASVASLVYPGSSRNHFTCGYT